MVRCFCVVIFVFVSSLMGGAISGHVCDTDGNPLIGATVMILGTSFGTMTNARGEYLIENLEPGNYSLRAGMVGMGERTIDGIEVFENQITVYDFGGPEIFGVYLQAVIIDEEPMCGRILVHRENLTVTDLPLEHTSASITVSGNLQRAVVRQVYGNPFDTPIDVTYVFPLPNNGAVDQMNVYIGDKLIEGHVYEKEIASEIYTEAVEEGRTAGLLVQQRPNVFTQKLGNILPGDSITVEISYVAPVNIYENEFELVFPMVVAPKYIPGNPIGQGEMGWSDPTDQVPDADRINPSVYPEGKRSGYSIDLSVTINVGIPVYDITSVNHEILVSEDNDVVSVSLEGDEVIPNRDFVLRYNVSSNRRETGILATHEDHVGHFMLVLKPEEDLSTENYFPREYVFVVDCSGSMEGQPMAVAKETMRHFMRNMSTDDTFQIVKFSNDASTFSEAPIQATRRNVNLGLAYVELMSGIGGSEMLSGVRVALGYPEDPEYDRYVIFITDGQIGNESGVLRVVRNSIGTRTLLWSVGVGAAPNRYLLDALAEEGDGNSFYVALQEDPSIAASRIRDQLAGAVIRDIVFDWGDLSISDVFPEETPNLYPGEPLFIVGRYSGGGSARVKVSGYIGEDRWSERFRVELPFHEEDNQAIASYWARQKIHQLERYLLDTGNDEEIDNGLINQITETALTYQLLSDYTSFVAVSEEVRTDEFGNNINIEIPVNMPEGMSYDGTFGSSTGGLAAESVGATVITVTDTRRLILRNVTSSVSVVTRDEVRTMPVASAPAPVVIPDEEVSTVETFVSQERDQFVTLESGATVVMLSFAVSPSVLDETEQNQLVSSILNTSAAVFDTQEEVEDGMLILRLTFPTGDGNVTVELLQNFTESSEFADEVCQAIEDLLLNEVAYRGLTIEFSLEFVSS